MSGVLRLIRALTRATLLVFAPSAPVAWSPGTAPLSESLRDRVRAGAGAAAGRAVAVMPASGRRVVSVPIDAAMRRISALDRPRRPNAERSVVPVAGARPPPARADAAVLGAVAVPWLAPEPVAGVSIRTTAVPAPWLRPTTARVETARDTAPAIGPEPRAVQARRQERPVPTSVRVRRAAVMAFGLLVSLVAVEAAARVGRR